MMDVNALITQLPNFAGMLIALGYLWQASKRQQTLIERLVDVIIKRENCEDDEPKPP
jgi:hypothetical protein